MLSVEIPSVSPLLAGSQWPANFDEMDVEPDLLETDTLRVIGQTDDPLLQTKLKENIELAEAATRALEHIYEEEPPPAPPVEQPPSPKTNAEAPTSVATSENHIAPTPAINGTGPPSSPSALNENASTTSSPSTGVSTNNSNELSSNSSVPPPPPPPPPPASSASPSPNTVAPATAVATTLPLAHSAAAIQAAYRQTGLLGALPAGGAIRTASGALYATAGGLANGLGGQMIYGGKQASFLSMQCLSSVYCSLQASPWTHFVATKLRAQALPLLLPHTPDRACNNQRCMPPNCKPSLSSNSKQRN